MEKPYQLPAARFAALESVAGFEVQRRFNTKLLGSHPTTLGYVAGNALRVHNVNDGSARALLTSFGYGVGGFAINAAGNVLAVAEKGVEGHTALLGPNGGTGAPAIHIYAYPSLEKMCSLENGTERAYSDVSFR